MAQAFNKILAPTFRAPMERTILVDSASTPTANITAATNSAAEIHAIALGAARVGGVIVPINTLDKAVDFVFTLPAAATNGQTHFRLCSQAQQQGRKTGVAPDHTTPGSMRITIRPPAGAKLYGLSETAAPANAKGVVLNWDHRWGSDATGAVRPNCLDGN